jgi:SAM-dependent methyltransferase
MHPSAYEFATTALKPPDVEHARVVETGAYDYNGSVRDAVLAMVPLSYTGTDVQPGPGVDLVCPAEDLPEALGDAAADVVISTEMLEHAHNWRAAMAGMVRLLAPGGLLVLTTRSAGFPYHPHPGDFWRYSLEQMAGIAAACGLDVDRLEDDPGAPGVFLRARKPPGWDGTGMMAGLAMIEPGPPR